MSLEELERCIAVDRDVVYLTRFAESLSFLDDPRAVGVWQEILDKDPGNCWAHVYMGHEKAKAGEWREALLLAKRADELAHSVKEVFEVGGLLHDLDEFETAVERYLEAGKLGYADKPLLYACVAACYLSLGKGAPAKRYAKRALRCDPGHDYARHVWHEYETRFASTE